MHQVLKLYENELFFSWVVRMYAIDNKSKDLFIKEMFGPGIFGLYRIRTFKNTRVKERLSIPQIIKAHSVLPVFKVCRPKEEYIKTLNDLDKYDQKYKPPSYVKICPLCWQEQMNRFGEAYFITEHQFNENKVCYKHKVDLIELDGIVNIEDGREQLSLDNIKLPIKNDYNEKVYYDISIMLSKMFDESIMKDIYLEDSMEKYKSKLRELHYYRFAILDRAKLGEDFISYYGKDVLNKLGASIDGKEYGWLSLFWGGRKEKLIYHLLMIIFLFGDLESFAAYTPKEFLPFGTGPWPCLNEKCDQYKKNVIEEIKIKRGTTTRSVIGICKCNKCKVEYRLEKFEDKSLEYNIDLYGEAFDDELLALCKKEEYTIRQLGKRMGCSGDTVQKHMKYCKINPEEYTKIVKRRRIIINVEKYKQKFLKIIKDKPNISFTEISAIEGYRYLTRHAPDFCKKELPVPSNKKVATNVRDQQVSREIENIAKKVLEKNLPTFLSKSFFRKEVGYSGIGDERMLKEMPLIREALAKWCETREEYKKRQNTC